jgi:hypothetical protein
VFRSPDSGASVGRRAQRALLSNGRPAAAAAALVGAVLAGFAFGAAAGTELTRTTVVEVLMVLLGGLVVAVAIVWGRSGPLDGAAALLAFVLLAVVTALSVTWAIAPGLAYVEAGRTLAYLAIFAAGVGAARLAPNASPTLIKGILAAAVAALLYGLAARIWPASLGENEISNRIGQPFEYWNAVGTTAALAVPGLLWLGARRAGSLWGRALAYPAMGTAMLAILLTQSRGALVAAALGALAWLAIVPLRLRSLSLLLVPAAGAGAVAAWALSKPAFSDAGLPLSAKEEVATEFGLLVFAMLALLYAAGYALNLGLARLVPSPRMRRQAGLAAVAAVGVVLLGAAGALALSDRGFGGTIDDRVDELTSETETAPTEGAGRLTASASTRSKYWKEARLVFEDRPSVGTGAGTFELARLRHRTDPSVTAHAHGFVPQTLADLGLVGLAVSLLLLLGWLVAAARTTALYPRRLPFRRGDDRPPPRRDWSADRIALVALALIAVVFGLQSAIDWTWFIPGPTAMALLAAGFVAGRGPDAAETVRGERGEPLSDPAPPRLLAAAGVLLTALLAAWAIWQPEAGDRATGRAVALSDQGQVDAALIEIEDARDANPLSSEALLIKAAIETGAGREQDAEQSLEEAVLKFPGEADTWYRLAAFQLGTQDRPEEAAETVKGALYLDPLSLNARALFLDSRARAREKVEAASR